MKYSTEQLAEILRAKRLPNDIRESKLSMNRLENALRDSALTGYARETLEKFHAQEAKVLDSLEREAAELGV